MWSDRSDAQAGVPQINRTRDPTGVRIQILSGSYGNISSGGEDEDSSVSRFWDRPEKAAAGAGDENTDEVRL